ncbi:type 4 prepilin peptidase 1 Aspartic peptidase. MEROPS family A24A [Geoalkalibacter ferrihydriticus]|nr:A24 family peptidase [Geoalkalibacter ferrihydriticus]SDL45168.1 type 4 prepilin peptidase 1 Aspartic peptidase. MEROPS family A24A [Geoalkalibacter ferrihydriticus]
MPFLFLIFSFVLGAVVGSFLNVCIYRIPEGLSVVSPGSRCPHCERPIRWYQNIPLLSWLVLRGRCAHCGAGISMRYPLVETLCGVLFLGVLWKFGLHAVTPVYWLLGAALIVITFIDLDHQIIPDAISLPGIVIGFGCSFAVPWVSWLDSLLGILVGGGSLLLVAMVYEFLTKKEGMGGGDIKLLAMIGAFLGWQAVFPIIFISSLAGTAVGIPVMIRQKADTRLALPFGPFLAFGALFYLFWGPEILHWYLGLFMS